MLGTIDRTFYETGKWILASAIAAAIFIWVFGDSWLTGVPDCYFETITGLYCPGCGGTRAVIALFRGHIVESFIYHPVVPYAAVVYVVFMVRVFMRKHNIVLRRGIISGNTEGRQAGHTEGTEKEKNQDGRVLIFIYAGIAIAIIQWVIKLVLLVKYDIHVI